MKLLEGRRFRRGDKKQEMMVDTKGRVFLGGGWTNPFEKYADVKIGSFLQGSSENKKNMGELPPPRFNITSENHHMKPQNLPVGKENPSFFLSCACRFSAFWGEPTWIIWVLGWVGPYITLDLCAAKIRSKLFFVEIGRFNDAIFYPQGSM